ncbi:MAG: DUF3800 domain-containing protein [Candidatus Omnitrophota bacterium]
MSVNYNIYCDESCHLENDHQKAMVLGGIWCPKEKVKEISNNLRQLKSHYGFKSNFEVKWTKVSPSEIHFYLSLIRYFFTDNHLHFRALAIPDKSILNHGSFNQTHDDWYYKMYFRMLKTILDLNSYSTYRIYIDIKDTKSAKKVEKLHDVLCNSLYDFDKNTIQRVQIIKSLESEILQLADLLIGAINYANRGVFTSTGKTHLVNQITNFSGLELIKSTAPYEDKFNLLIWRPR